MTRLTCPECDAKFRPKNPPRAGKKIRCPECEHAFLPEIEEEEEEAADEEETKPAKKKKPADDDDEPADEPKKKNKKGKAKQGSRTMLFVGIGAGVVVLLLGVVCAGVLVYVFSSGGGGGLFAKAPEVSGANFAKIEHAMTNAEIDSILGAPGTKATPQQAVQLISRFDREPQDPLSFEVTRRYVIYTKGRNHIVVGFVPSKKYTELSCYHGLFEETADGGMGSRTMRSDSRSVDNFRDALLKRRPELKK